MTLSKAVSHDHFTEAEAAKALGITISRLHDLLDRYVFNEGRHRPANIEFTSSDLTLLAYWNKEPRRTGDGARNNVVAIDTRKPRS